MVKNGIGSPLGNGQQYMPWIHIDDAVNIFFNSIINDKIFGTFNAVSSDYITNSELTKKIGEVFNKKKYGFPMCQVLYLNFYMEKCLTPY